MITLLLGVDRIVDMCRTTLNITGDGIGTFIVAKLENEVDTTIFENFDKAESIL